MTNTPMKSKEAFEKFMSDKGLAFNYIGDGQYSQFSVQLASEAWQTSQAQQAQTIAELKEDLLDLRTQVNYRCADVQRLTELNVELVEALDYIAETPIHPNIDVVGMYRNVARKAIAKVKGK